LAKPGKILNLAFLSALLTYSAACSKMEAPGASHLSSSSRFQVQSFDDLEDELEDDYTPRPEDPEGPKSRPITVVPSVVRLCMIGELDIVEAAKNCGINAPLLVTVRDSNGERVLGSVSLGQDIETVISQLARSFSGTSHGDHINIFVCIDGNQNGRCSDEPILDLNQATADLSAGNAGVLCGKLSKGLLIYHKYHVFAVANASSNVGNTVQQPLSNHGADEQQGGVFPITLTKAQPKSVCPKPAIRTTGCFVKGTKIAISKDSAVPVEALRAGNTVRLADGRSSRILKVVAGPEVKPVISFATAEGPVIVVTAEHPLLTKKGMKLAREITIHDELKVSGLDKFTALKSISQQAYDGDVYNFELAGNKEADHLVIADGLVSGDLYLQIKMSSGRKNSLGHRLLTER